MFEEIINRMRSAILASNKKILEIYNSGFDVKLKDDKSPVTTADLASDKIIRENLFIDSSFYYLSEEEVDDLTRLNKKAGFIVDPLDGTSDFVLKDNSFSVNIAFCINGVPVIAFIGLPYFQEYCYAIKDMGSYYVDKEGKETKLQVSSRTKDLIYLASKTHELEKEKEVYLMHASLISKVVRSGASTKAILLAKGEADCSIRYTTMTKEWDVCAPDLIVKEAGGIFLDTSLNEFKYNKKDVYNHLGYCMFNRVENERLLK